MKKLLLLLAVLGLSAAGSISPVAAQEDEDLLAIEDTLSIDDMDPVFYEEEKSEESNLTTILIVAGVVVVAAGVYFFAKKKKK